MKIGRRWPAKNVPEGAQKPKIKCMCRWGSWGGEHSLSDLEEGSGWAERREGGLHLGPGVVFSFFLLSFLLSLSLFPPFLPPPFLSLSSFLSPPGRAACGHSCHGVLPMALTRAHRPSTAEALQAGAAFALAHPSAPEAQALPLPTHPNSASFPRSSKGPPVTRPVSTRERSSSLENPNYLLRPPLRVSATCPSLPGLLRRGDVLSCSLNSAGGRVVRAAGHKVRSFPRFW